MWRARVTQREGGRGERLQGSLVRHWVKGVENQTKGKKIIKIWGSVHGEEGNPSREAEQASTKVEGVNNGHLRS